MPTIAARPFPNGSLPSAAFPSALSVPFAACPLVGPYLRGPQSTAVSHGKGGRPQTLRVQTFLTDNFGQMLRSLKGHVLRHWEAYDSFGIVSIAFPREILVYSNVSTTRHREP